MSSYRKIFGRTERGRPTVASGVLSTIGRTPLVRLDRLIEESRLNIFGKLESANPGGSVKDRPALNIIRRALSDNVIQRGGTVIESSSGNMAIGLAQACLYYGLHLICVVDVKATSQNLNILRAYGATIDLVTEPDPITGEYLEARLRRVQALLRAHEGSFWPNQYTNTGNSDAHHATMEEIAAAVGTPVDYLFCAISTCGTLRGCSEYIRKHRLRTKVYAVDAVGSVIFGGRPAKRLIPGHGASVTPKLFDESLADRHVLVSDLDCVLGCQRLLRREAILAGGSSGAIVSALVKAHDDIESGSNCVLILPDRGERYLDTIYSEPWVRQHFGDVLNATVAVQAGTNRGPGPSRIASRAGDLADG